MTRGEDRAGAIQQPRSEIKLIGGRQSDSHHIQALAGHPGRESRGERRRTIPHIVADDHLSGAFSTHQSGERGADVGHQRIIDLFAYQPAYVVSLDDTVDIRGGPRHAEAPDDLDLLRLFDVSLSAPQSYGPKRCAGIRRSANRQGRATPADARDGVQNDARGARADHCSARWHGLRWGEWQGRR